jgi:CheY-like chemotaxis protein
MAESISHRGPDDSGLEWFSDSGSGIAHKRLSILDLSPGGHQPMATDGQDLWLVFNGEIYNHEELRHELTAKGILFKSRSDTEALFRQAEGSSTRPYGGLGLGLAIVRHLVELHGGTVHAASAGLGHGTTFTVVLPVRAGRATKTGDPVAPRMLSAATRARSRALAGITVLLVEDEDDTREILTLALAQHGASVTSVSSVASARDALARGVPHVLVSDIGMRGEDGYTLIREIRRRHDETRALPSVALTAYAGVEDRRRALREGYDVHLAKPIDPDALVAVVAELAPPGALEQGRAETA